jgi:hypothetical protein
MAASVIKDFQVWWNTRAQDDQILRKKNLRRVTAKIVLHAKAIDLLKRN